MLVGVDHDRVALALRDGDGDDLLGQPAVLLRRHGLVLAADSEGILVGAADAELLGDVLAGLGHGIDAVLLLHQRVDETPADGGVVDLRIAREGGLGLGHHEGRAAHRFDAAGDHDLGLAGLDCARRDGGGVHARAAEAVDGRARNRLRQAGQKQRHARDVAVVLAGLVGAAIDDVVYGLPVDGGVPFHQRLERHRAEIVGPDGGQCAAETADGRANIGADKGFGHFKPPERLDL